MGAWSLSHWTTREVCILAFLIMAFRSHMVTKERCVCLVAQLCPTLFDPMDEAHKASLSMGILQAGVLEWVAMPSSKGSSQPRDRTLGFPGGSAGKESVCNAGDLGLIPGLGRSPGGGHGNPLQYSCLENPHGQRSLAGYRPGGHKQSDTTEQQSTLLSLLLSCLIYLSPW